MTDELIAQVRRLARDGLTQVEIGGRIGRTANAIASMVRRYKIELVRGHVVRQQAQDWTDDEIKILRQMAADGKTQTEIGKATGRSRGAVGGKLNRLGLGIAAKATSQARTARINKGAAWRGSSAAKPKVPKGFPDASFGPRLKTPLPLACEPVSKRLSLEALDRGQCHWPDVAADGPAQFCGHDAGKKTYCPFHAQASTYRGLKRLREAA